MHIKEILKIPNIFFRIQKHHLLLNYGSLKLGALKDNIIPQGKWEAHSVIGGSFAKQALPTDFGFRKDRCVAHQKKE